MRWSTIVPLIGGGVVASRNVTGVDPVSIMSYSPFGENDSNIRAYMKNVPYHVLDNPDLGDKPFDVANHQDLDFVTALCPCAGLSALSSAGKEQRDKMNTWMLNTAEFVTGTVRPKVLWGENAPGLFSGVGDTVRGQLTDIAHKNGYSFSVYRTSTLYHGVPQHRKRTFYFFWRDSDVPLFSSFRRSYTPLDAYMAQVPHGIQYQTDEDISAATERLETNDLVRFLRAFRGTHWLQELRDYIVEQDKAGLTLLSYINFRKWMDEASFWLKENGADKAARDIDRVRTKLAAGQGFWDNSHYIFSSKGYFTALVYRNMQAIHPTEEREITLREAMHLMALPHDFQLVTGIPNNICQNVPVCTAEDMAREVVAFLKGERESTGKNFYLQDNLLEQQQPQATTATHVLEY